MIRTDGIPRNVHREYLMYMGELRKEKLNPLNSGNEKLEKVEEKTEEAEKTETIQELNAHHRGTGEARIVSVETLNQDGKKVNVFSTDEPIIFRVSY